MLGPSGDTADVMGIVDVDFKEYGDVDGSESGLLYIGLYGCCLILLIVIGVDLLCNVDVSVVSVVIVIGWCFNDLVDCFGTISLM